MRNPFMFLLGFLVVFTTGFSTPFAKEHDDNCTTALKGPKHVDVEFWSPYEVMAEPLRSQVSTAEECVQAALMRMNAIGTKITLNASYNIAYGPAETYMRVKSIHFMFQGNRAAVIEGSVTPTKIKAQK